MSKKQEKKEIVNNNKPPKQKKTAYEKQTWLMIIAGILMALIMVFGAVMSVVGMFITG